MSEINLFSLIPPGSIGEGYGNLVIGAGGQPLGNAATGQAVAQMLGFSDKDTIGSSLDEVIQMATTLNLSLVFSGSSIDKEINVYLNTADPSKPGLPPIKSLLILLERELQAGKLGNVQINKKSDVEAEINVKDETGQDTKKTQVDYNYTNDASAVSTSFGDNTVLANDEKIRQQMSDVSKNNIEIGREINLASAADATATVTAGQGTGGNPWLSGNVYVVFLMCFMELQRTLMKSKVVEGNIELSSMHLTYQLAKETADMIMKIAEMNRMLHIAQAAMAAVSLAVSVGSAAFGLSGMGFSPLKGMKGTFGISSKTGYFQNPTQAGRMELSMTLSALGSGLDKMVTSAMQAALDVPIAEKEGAKEMLQAIRTLIQRQMEKAGEAFKNHEESIRDLLQTLDKIRDGLQQAVANALRK